MDWNETVIAQLRAGEARIADTFDRDALLLLHTTGARSGEPRVSPVAYFEGGDHLLVVASKAGADSHPAWYHNLLAHPSVAVERWVGDRFESAPVTARALDGEERDRAWAQITSRAPGFGEYQKQTERVIPVVELTPTP
jgi:deazaflavin-dependent oxidoreductase (nitroreductase family)